MPFAVLYECCFCIPAPAKRRCPARIIAKVISYSDGHSILDNLVYCKPYLRIYYIGVLTQRQYFCIMFFGAMLIV